MAWKNKVAHKLTRGYLCRRYEIPATELIKDPKIKDMPFYNPEVSSEVRKNEMRIVAGRLLRFCADMNLDMEPDGNLDETFNALVDLLENGNANSSEIGGKIDSCFKCVDEE